MKKSRFRFLPEPRSGCYSVQRRDEHIGYVEKNAYRVTVAGETVTRHTWIALKADATRLVEVFRTRELAAQALATYRQENP